MRALSRKTRLSEIGAQLRESHLQNAINALSSGCDGWLPVGFPSWLLAETRKNIASRVSCDAYGFTPDVVWNGVAPIVAELKRSSKWEEIALVEVLHHAKRLQSASEGDQATEYTPLMICSYSAWTRSALCYLFEHGLQKDSIRYLETTFLENESGQRFLWLYDPFAEWIREETAPFSSAEMTSDPIDWYQVAQSQVWIGMNSGGSITDRSTVWPRMFIGAVGVDPGQFVVCETISQKPWCRYELWQQS